MVEIKYTVLVGALLASGLMYYFLHKKPENDSYYDNIGGDVGTINTPVIIVPGTYSSKLMAHLDKGTEMYKCFNKTDITVWMNEEYFDLKYFKCIIELLKIQSVKGVDLYVPDFGSTDTIRYLGPPSENTAYMANFIDMLLKLGYKKNNIHGAGFDFRYAPDHHFINGSFFRDLTSLIMKSYKETGNKKVVLVCHSMGCLYSLFFLQATSANFKDKYIDKLFTISGAFGGSVSSILSVTYGYDFGLSLGLVGTHLLGDASKTQPSTYFLMPNPLAFKNETLAIVEDVKYTANNIDKLLDTLDNHLGEKIYDQVKNLVDVSIGPGVDTYCLYGTDVKTTNQVIVPNMLAMQGISDVTYGLGDGVVNEQSLSLCKLWTPENNNKHSLVVQNFPGARHTPILNDEAVYKYLTPYLTQ